MFIEIKKIYLNNEFIYYHCILQNGKQMAVPLAEDNTDYQAIQQWISEGNTVIDNGN